ncbi:MAG TPA: AAA domain-containing protein, partial [Ardenticatenaceae bacterium]|nr:AAA domain-containing protein [Ardenticatenaceae bacterium]
LVRREAEKKTRHLPLRALLRQAPQVLTTLCPCWMASPLSVSQLLDADERYFDVVIFDEASQVLPEDAVPALLRATRAVVAGDKHQLPPTMFFAAGEDEGEEEAVTTAGFESVLDVLTAFFPLWSLDWHYRSRDEALIAFSNRHIYAERLITFPGPGGPPAISHVLVSQVPADGQEESVSEEVRRVVELVVEHATQRPGKSLGVIAMGIRQAQRVQAADDLALVSRPELAPFFDTSRDERFFVKNLERVQGDERDNIILTIGYGKDRSGRLPYRFGPLLTEGGERRLNVAITRARERLTLVSSFSHLDMDPARSSARGVELLRLYLQYAASRGRILGTSSHSSIPLNPFEADVLDTLRAKGIPLLPQWGASRYRLDFVAQHPERPGRFVLAIECDGATYHSTPTARDRDRLRQQHLEALGWRFHRIWSTDWFMRREQEIERAVAAFRQAIAQADREEAPEAGAIDQDREHVNDRLARAEEDYGHEPASVPASPPLASERAPRPRIPQRASITEYTDRELDALVRWLRSDGRLRTDEEIITEMVRELGFRRRGPRIEAALEAALARTLPRS